MRAIIRKWVAQIVTISMLAGCVLPQGQTIWGGGNNTLSQNSATAPDSDDVWDGDIKLEIDPGLMGDKYKHLKKVSFVSDTEGEDFSIQSSRHYKNYKKYLKPEFQCVQSLPDGSYRAYFGYHNTNNNTINIPIGSKNKVLPAEPMLRWKHKKKKKFDQGQPTRFTPGRVGPFPSSAFSVDFDHGNVHWLLNGKTAKANKRSTRCPVGPTPTPQPTQTPSATPTPTLPPSPTPTPGGSPTPTPSFPPSPTPTPVPTDTPTPTPEPTEEPTPTPMPTPSDVVFDPADPSTLGDLFPDVPGNNPNLSEPETVAAAFMLNNSPPSPTENAVIGVALAEPVQANLQTILDRYNGTVQSVVNDNFYFIKIDMTEVDLSILQTNIQIVNSQIFTTKPDYVLTQASFGNLESAKTFAAIVDLIANGLVQGASLNNVYENSGFSVNSIERVGFGTGFAQGLNSSESWWLNNNSTKVTGAWDYSMGFNVQENRPVSIAVIDAGFAGLYRDMFAGVPAPELPVSKIDWAKGSSWFNGVKRTWTATVSSTGRNYLQQEDFTCPLFASDCQNNPESHGTQVISTIVAEANNGAGIAGVAPQAKIIPLKIGNGQFYSPRDHLDALNELSRIVVAGNNVDVVNQSIGAGNFNFSDEYFSKISLDPNVANYSVNVFQKVDALTQLGVVFVGAAGNGSYDADRNIIAGQSMLNRVITVGAIEDSNTTTAAPPIDLQRAIFTNPFSLPLSVQKIHGSNYGPSLHLWAPGDNMFTYTVPLGATSPGLQAWEGTSAAAPIVTGIVALLKAQNASLTTSQILTLLRSSAIKKTNIIDNLVRTTPFVDNGLFTSQICSSLSAPPGVCSCGGFLPNSNYYFLNQVNCGTFTSTVYDMDIVNAEQAMINSGFSKAVELDGELLLIPAPGGGSLVQFSTPSNSYQMQWGAVTNSNIIGNLQAEDTTVSPSTFVSIDSLISSSANVKVKGIVNGNKIIFHSVKKIFAPPSPTGKVWKLKLFNVNDLAEVWINGSRIDSLTLHTNTGAGFSNVDRFIDGVDISSFLSATGLNTINFKIYNNDTNQPFFNLPFPFSAISSGESIDNGSSWGIELTADNQIVYRDIRGSASSRSASLTAPFGARRASFSQGLVLDDTISVNKNGNVPISSGSYQVRVYNVSDNVIATVNGTQVSSLNSQSPFETFYTIDSNMHSGTNTFSFEVKAANNTSTTTYPGAIPAFILSDPNFPLGNLTAINNNLQIQRATYTWGFDVFRNNTLIYRNRDGERENLDVGSGNFRSFPSGAEFNTRTTNSPGTLMKSDQFNLTLP
ncbi:hypothetical protein COW36_24920 [bacterium (Candidatus Blackallbacteria) CG17_big_fil_post_rev_8_21_14_2_50_48_46]|uniref:Peptidase S8/S53 domain-containing protein n=1 Tax=bacterium (Candidatus Blackallbacteria) CG17_big_fil_post_rev_8_21_14_2_50_48_46 TaxID=2014261 RepID=A0A2M7FX51_9BACT|nr:MAG: hypothetical protein COW64_07925 [bacterium (Candidatus Blackallbacteria) CG18_big_fil_WC_8_21_14_2_50_49_26]PIW13647.1 MAG: hypothetical protein COW36_24920 [bacterium (Candidatus Blackallbacteria) CG17_big_fil_post_rev_8_21_14_2_50_48_46]PIW49170.1 MAG: hypothetical protein COW20_06750 [bacterium (Candidatus Blackallbacteria) CG13_big_fil_rev_8_21_14_2_50_49_14]